MNAVTSIKEINHRSCGVTVGHPQVRHPVQCRTPHKHLRGLSFKGACTDPLTKDSFHSKDLCLGQRAAMIAALAFPLSVPLLPDGTQVLITHVSLGKGVAMLPNLRPLLWRDA